MGEARSVPITTTRVSYARGLLCVALVCSGCECKERSPTRGDAMLPEFGPGVDANAKAKTKTARGPKLVLCDAVEGCPIAPSLGAPGGELRIAVDAEPSALCDLVEHDVWSRWIAENWINETLVEQDPRTGDYRPRLASKFLFSADGKTLDLELQPEARWHDDRPFSASDVLATFAIVQHKHSGADQKSDLASVTKVEAVSTHAVRLHLSQPAPYLLQALAHLTIWPAHLLAGVDPGALGQRPFVRAPIGTGPYRFASWQSGVEIVLTRAPKYWGKPPSIERLRFVIVRDRGVALSLVERGELDVLWRLPPGRRDEVLAEPKLAGATVFEWTPRAYYFVVYNLRSPLLADVRVRRAIDMLIDRQRFSQVAFGGRAPLATGPYVRGSSSYDTTIAPPSRDVERARALLTEALGGKKVGLTFLATAGSRTVEQLATGIVQDLAPLGIDVAIENVDFATQLERLRRGDFLLSALQLTVAREQDNYNLFHSSQAAGGQNYAGLRDPEVDKLLDQARTTADPAARHALDRRLHKLLSEKLPFSFLVAAPVETLIGPRVRGLAPSNDGFDFRTATVDTK